MSWPSPEELKLLLGHIQTVLGERGAMPMNALHAEVHRRWWIRLDRSLVRQALSVMAEQGVVVRDSDGAYRLGPRAPR